MRRLLTVLALLVVLQIGAAPAFAFHDPPPGPPNEVKAAEICGHTHPPPWCTGH